MHLVRLRCENSEYPDIPAFSRVAGRVPQRLKLLTYFFANPKRGQFLLTNVPDYCNEIGTAIVRLQRHSIEA
jgi:hypothetical protein